METLNNHEPFTRFNPLNDFLFFKVFGEKGDEPQLLGFLNAVLSCSHRTWRSGKKPIESVEIIENTAFRKNVIEGKSCILDVLAVLHNGTKVNIEVQLSNQYNMERRSLFYWGKVYGEYPHLFPPAGSDRPVVNTVSGTGNTLRQYGKMAETEGKGFGGSPEPVAGVV